MPLTENREVDRFVDQDLRSVPVAADVQIFKGALLGVNASTGGFRPLVAGDEFGGIAYEEANNKGGELGDRHVRTFTQGDFLHALTGAATANNGAEVYASADNVLTLTADGNSFVGRQVSVASSDNIVLRIATVFARHADPVVDPG